MVSLHWNVFVSPSPAPYLSESWFALQYAYGTPARLQQRLANAAAPPHQQLEE